MLCDAMEYFVLAILALAAVTFQGTAVVGSINCVNACDKTRQYIDCNKSLILISDVTNLMMETNRMAFENIKRDCMGRVSCNPFRACSTERQQQQQQLIVHYSCVNASLTLSKTCSWPGVMMNGSYGNIQSPDYPAAMSVSSTCQWTIVPGSGNAVVLSLNDIVYTNSQRICEDGLVVQGKPCSGEPQNLHRFCSRDNVTRMVLCGKVEIQLRKTNIPVELRFWLSFHVWPRNQVPKTENSVSHCSDITQGNKHLQRDFYTTEASVSSGTGSQDSNTEVLVIMLSIISGISAVLLIILIVVCVRCRLLQASHAEFANSDPSPSMPAHYVYISTSEQEKARPQLADGYFQVSDALHFVQSAELPLTPAYAEVEQFPQGSDYHQSSSLEEISRESISLSKKNQHESVLKNAADKQTDNADVSVDTSQSVFSRLKKQRTKQGQADNNTISKNRATSVKSEAGLSTTLVSTPMALHSRTSSDDDGSSNYETIGKCAPTKTHLSSDHRPQVPPNHPQSKTLSTKLLPTFSDNTYSVVNSNMKPDCDNGIDSPVSRSKTLPSRSLKVPTQTSQTNNNDKRHTTYRHVPRGSGIVRNGIKKFEQNST